MFENLRIRSVAPAAVASATASAPATLQTKTGMPSGGRQTIQCPERDTRSNVRCLKLHNPDPAAKWDFWLMQLRQVVGDSSQLTNFIPLEGGGFRKFTSRVHSRQIESIRSLETYEAETYDAGAARLDKVEVRRFYQRLRSSIYVTRGTVQDFDAEGRPAGNIAPIEQAIWPDLPGDCEVSALLRSFARERSAPQPLVNFDVGVSFAKAEPIADGDYVVAEGEVQVGDQLRRRCASVGGIRIETSWQGGVPTLVTNDFFLLEAGKTRRLFGDRCAQDVFQQVLEVYKSKRDRGLFRSRSKLTVIRRELRVNTFTWSDT